MKPNPGAAKHPEIPAWNAENLFYKDSDRNRQDKLQDRHAESASAMPGAPIEK
jgi:hypothetical protein